MTITRWQPLTCACVIEYDERLRVVASEPCEKHKGVEPVLLLSVVIADNRSANA